MPYERSLEIENRLQQVLRCVAAGTYSTPQIAAELGVSVPTVSRNVLALRKRGYVIRSRKGSDGWRYVLDEDSTPPESVVGRWKGKSA